jgi:hypothetical protein
MFHEMLHFKYGPLSGDSNRAAHASAIDADPNHVLSAQQIADYHWSVFANYGLGAETFGGSIVFCTRAEVWATSGVWRSRCDD